MRQGAFWLITKTLAADTSVRLTLLFENPDRLPLQYGLTVQDHAGYSEAVASARAFKSLDSSSQGYLISFLRAQLIGGKLGEGSGGERPAP